MIAATIVCALACGVLVVAEWRQRLALRAVAKTFASLAFVAVALLAISANARLPLTPTSSGLYPPTVWRSFETAIAIGLGFGVLGDLALLGKSKRAFLAGLGAFLIGHLAYVAGIAELIAPGNWISSAGPLAGAPIAVAVVAVIALWPRLGALRIPVLAYVATIVAMVVGAIAAMNAGELTLPNRRLLCAGAALFFASDLSVARDKFVGSSFANKAWGLPAYYAGQLLIAWSLAL